MKDDFKRISCREVSHDGFKGDFSKGEDRQRHRRRVRARLKRQTDAQTVEQTRTVRMCARPGLWAERVLRRGA